MNLALTNEMVQLVAWFLALITFILALYVLLLNAWHTANRHVSALLLIFAINLFAAGLMADATNQTQTTIATYLLAATTPAVNAGLLIVAVVLLKPQWLHGQRRWIWWPVYGLVLLPALLTLMDVGLGTRLWYTGLVAATHPSGYATMATYTAGSLSLPLRVLGMYLISTVTIIPLLYVALLDKTVTPLTHRLAWLLLGALVTVIVVQFGLRGLLGEVVAVLISGVVFIGAYAYAAFQQMISERRLQRGRLQIRLTALILVVTVPILMTIVSFINVRSAVLIEQIVVREQQTELLGALQQFRQISWTALVIGIVMVSVLAWLTIRQMLRPIRALTDTVTAIAAGDLTRVAPVESEDELGVLARAFNRMAEQLRGLISGLEQRVTDRTRDLEQRSVQLEVAAQVAREAAAIHDVAELLNATVRLISERFGFYHAGIFLLNEPGEYVVLQAASSEGGQRMLARGHRLKVGEVGVVGYVADAGKSRIALDINGDAVFDNPDLPGTRSEMALPLKVRERVIGVLDVQSTEEAAFSDEDVEVLQILADQVALAIENARLLAASQQALQELETFYGQRVREAWTERGARQPTYHYTGMEVESARHYPPVAQPRDDGRQLIAPIRLRDQRIGSLVLRRDVGEAPWSDEEAQLVEEVGLQIGLALENARLVEETRRRAAREQLTREITDRIRASTSVEDAIQQAIREMARALGVSETVARIGTEHDLLDRRQGEHHE